MNRRTATVAALALLCGACAIAAPMEMSGGAAIGPATTFEDLMSLDAEKADAIAPRGVVLTPVREAALREAALVLGVQWGLRDRSREILVQVNAMATSLDRRYEFGSLMMGVAFLPPVISEVRNATAIEGNVLRVAKKVYRFDEPPRPVVVAPTWRDWLLVGLNPDMVPKLPVGRASYPKDERELAYWRQTLRSAYAEGRKQADESYFANLNWLDRTYDGMRRFYKLFKSGQVTAPVIASATTIADRSEPGVMVVGNTVIRVTVQSEFVGENDKWVPLAN